MNNGSGTLHYNAEGFCVNMTTNLLHLLSKE